jgi:hypothetical protein
VGDRLIGSYFGQIDGSYARVFDVIADVFDQGGPTKGRLWSDAEQFLASVEQPDGMARPILDLLQQVLQKIARVPKSLGNQSSLPVTYELPKAHFALFGHLSWWVKILLALECDAFLLHRARDIQSEYWLPYLKWKEQIVESHDTVITFNYDRVLETLSGVSDGSETFNIVLPWANPALDQAKPNVFKLHGSVDWSVDGARTNPAQIGLKSPFPVANHWLQMTNHQSGLPVHLTNSSEVHPLMGVPGPQKKALAEQLLKPLWDLALKELESATEVVFVGYRFPPSDSYALKSLMDALSKQPEDKSVGFVLGIDQPSQIQRLSTMLQCSGRHVLQSPLFAQDFFTLYQGQMIRGSLFPIHSPAPTKSAVFLL